MEKVRRKVKKESLLLLKSIKKAEYSKFFRKPVDVEKYKCYDYYDKITDPMDISTIIVNFMFYTLIINRQN